MAYHKLGLDKYRRFGLAREVDLPGESASLSLLRDWIDRLRAVGVDVINDQHMVRNGTTKESTCKKWPRHFLQVIQTLGGQP